MMRGMNHKRRIWMGLLFTCAGIALTVGKVTAQQIPHAGPADTNWAQVQEILKRIKPPEFPKHEFDITKFGAKGDGATDCTEAFREAIAACNEAGGGRVVVPSGKF